MTADEVVDAKKMKIGEEKAWAMLKSAEAVTIARGNKFREFYPATDDKATILKQAMGPSGNLRAPTFRIEDRYVIGFNVELYEDWLG